MQLLKGVDLVEVPWKNGGGITRNIAEGKTALGPTWRLSRADVAGDGPFSNFAGCGGYLPLSPALAWTFCTRMAPCAPIR